MQGQRAEQMGAALGSSSPVTSSSVRAKWDAVLLQGRYRRLRKIGSGTFGVIYSALDTEKNEEVAVKVERRRSETLAHEYQVYQAMQGGVGIPSVRSFGKEERQSMLVMDLLGPSLEDLFNNCHRKFSLKTVLLLADQMIPLLEYFHSKNYLHRDIKPENFVMGNGGKGNGNTVYIIDFGLAKRYRSDEGDHAPFAESKTMTGTARYVSINTHQRLEQSRRDDMEALGYLLLYFARGGLPWQRIMGETKADRYANIAEMKMKTSLDSLTAGLPAEFSHYMQYCRHLGYEETPDYEYLRLLFRYVLYSQYQYDNCKFDWVDMKDAFRVPTTTVIGVRRTAKQAFQDANKEKENAKALKKES